MHQVRTFLELVKFEHTIFALPIGYVGMVLAARGLPTLHQFIWITLAMVSARMLGMGANRLIDRHIDAQNPRTADRPIQTGRVSVRSVVIGSTAALVILTISAWQLTPLALELLPVAVAFLVGYPYAKRFTWLANYMLGATDGLAPIGAWIAVRGSLFTLHDLPAWLLWFAMIAWMGGADTIYGCLDTPFDRRAGLHSVSARWGNVWALRISALSHFITIGLFGAVGVLMRLDGIYWIGLIVVGGLLTYEHSLVRPDDLSQFNVAFNHVNGLVGVALLCATLVAMRVG